MQLDRACIGEKTLTRKQPEIELRKGNINNSRLILRINTFCVWRFIQDVADKERSNNLGLIEVYTQKYAPTEVHSRKIGHTSSEGVLDEHLCDPEKVLMN